VRGCEHAGEFIETPAIHHALPSDHPRPVPGEQFRIALFSASGGPGSYA
jgi:hypothetical protein